MKTRILEKLVKELPPSLFIDKMTISVILFLVSFAVYLPALKAPFFWDDYISIPEIQVYKGIEHTESRPLRVFSFFVDSFLWKGNPSGYHFTNLLLNSIASVLVFLFMEKFFKNKIFSFLVSVLFLLHPVHTETVIWIKNRTEILFLIFFILSFLLYKKIFILSLLSFVLCTLSKETSVVFPVFLILFIYFFEKEKKYAGTIPFFIISLARGIHGLIYAEKIVGEGTLPFFTNICAVLNTYRFYLGKLIFPLKLLVDREPNYNFSLLSLVVFLFFVYIIFRFEIAQKLRFFLIFLFVSILPYSNVIFIAGRPLGEQRMFLASLAFSAVVFLLVTSIKVKFLKYGFLLFLIVFYSGRTYLRAKEWQEPVLLWKQAEKFYPDSARIKHNLGSIYYEKGDYRAAKKYYLQAVGRSDYDSYISLHNLALIYMKDGEFEEAEKIFKRTLEMKPKNVSTLYNLGLLYMETKKYKDAVQYLDEAKKLNPQAIQIYNNLAVSYQESGNAAKAIEVLKEALNIEPKYLNGRYNLIVICKKSGRIEEALKETENALKIFPENPVFLKLYQEFKNAG